MNNYNPYLDEFLKMYSQSLISTEKTRGYDPDTYVETKLDRELIPRIFNAGTRLVILTGNAGDGKTAFIQRIEAIARKQGATFSTQTENGCKFELNGISYETLYDGSQDFQGRNNELLLTTLFRDFEGNREPVGSFTKIIAINEGKLRDFILRKPKYGWLGKFTHHYLEYDDYGLPESLVFLNLNLRSVVDGNDDQDSIFDMLLNRWLDNGNTKGIWDHCKPDNCAYADKCYVKFNVDSLRNKTLGGEIRKRLKTLVLAAHLKRVKHVTIRDIRSLLSFIIFNKYDCKTIQKNVDDGTSYIDRFYYNNAFNSEERDRILQILSELDVAKVNNPKLDNFLYFVSPGSSDYQNILCRSTDTLSADIPLLQDVFNGRPEGTHDSDPARKLNAQLFHRSMRRKLYFEGDSEKMTHTFLCSWEDLLPYGKFKEFSAFMSSGQDHKSEIRRDLTLAISKSEHIYNDIVGQENLCLRSSTSKNSTTKAFYGFRSSDFEVTLSMIGDQNRYLEYYPNCLVLQLVDKTARLEISIDLFEILMRIREGYIPSPSEIRSFFLNLEMFKRRVVTTRSSSVFLTEDDSNLFKVERNSKHKLIMTKVGN
jgi:hypothetical protein